MRAAARRRRAGPGDAPLMSETTDNVAIERPEPRASVQDELAEVTALLRRHRLVEGLVIDQREPGSGAAN